MKDEALESTLVNQIDSLDSEYGKLILDINKIPLTERGVFDFYWPINTFEINRIYLELLGDTVSIVRNAIREEVDGADLGIILYFHFLHEVICLYQAVLLIQRAKKDGIDITAASRSRLVRPLLKNETPTLTGIIQQLRQGPPKAKLWRLPLRIIRDMLIGYKQRIKRRTLFPVSYKKNIISMTIDSLAIRYAKEGKKRVIFRRLSNWFHAPTVREIRSSSDYPVMRQKLFHAALNIFQDVQRNLHNHVETYLSAWLTEAFILVDSYWKQLQSRSKKIPKNLWTITSGDIWGRILARAVRKKGGTVTRFNHGSGCGYFSSGIEQGHYDFEDCDEFVNLSEAQNKSLVEAFTRNEIVQSYPPTFKKVSNSNDLFKTAISVKDKYSKRGCCVMYIASVYPGEHVYISSRGLMSDVVMLDWEVRLLAKLKSWNFDYILKSHPVQTNCIAAPKSIEYLFGPIIESEYLEKTLDKADIFLVDNPASTIFSTLILSRKPFVYLDFKVVEFTPEARELLAHRCPIVEGWYDEKNRAQIDWYALYKAILNCHQYADTSFEYTYFCKGVGIE